MKYSQYVIENLNFQGSIYHFRELLVFWPFIMISNFLLPTLETLKRLLKNNVKSKYYLINTFQTDKTKDKESNQLEELFANNKYTKVNFQGL